MASLSGAEVARKVLVVDDSRDTMELLVMLLELHGFDVRGVGPDQAPLELVASWRPDVLLTDLHMPGLRGDELARQAGALCPGLLRACLSGVPLAELEAARAAGDFDCVWRKPMDVDVLAARLAA